MSAHLTPTEVAEALDAGRYWSRLGVPFVVALPALDDQGQWDPAGGNGGTGYWLPRGWQGAKADPAVIDQWIEGYALIAVMGHGLDLLDVDPRHGGDGSLAAIRLDDAKPEHYAKALTPSDGEHYFIAGLNVGSCDDLVPGIDVKGGKDDSSSRGFAFVSPTVRLSKTTGEIAPYRWVEMGDVSLVLDPEDTDDPDLSGQALADIIRQSRKAKKWDTVPVVGAGDHGWEPKALTAYGAKTLDGECERLSQLVEGGRNSGLVRAAYRCGQVAARTIDGEFCIDPKEMRSRLHAVAVRIGLDPGPIDLDQGEIMPTIKSGWGAGTLNPRALPEQRERPTAGFLYEPEDGGEAGEAVADDADQGVEEARPKKSKKGDGQRRHPNSYFDGTGPLIAQIAAAARADGDLIAYGRDGSWWEHDGGVWRNEPDAVERRVVRILGDRYRRSHGTNVQDVLRATSPRITCDPTTNHINFTNGMLRWETGDLEPHDPALYSTVQLGTAWDPEATCPEFDRFLSQVLTPEFIPLVWEMIGYLLYSGNALQVAFLLYGEGGNGKGTLMQVLKALLGETNVAAESLDELNSNRFAMVGLLGKIANMAGDIDATYQTSTAPFKKLTGGDPIGAERKYGDRFVFSPWAVPIFSANKIPGSADTSEGYLRRWVILEFPHKFVGDDRVADLSETLVKELPGIAAKAIPSLQRVMVAKVFTEVASAKARFAATIDQVRQWAEERTEPETGNRVKRRDLYVDYQNWANENGGSRPVGPGEFYRRLAAAGYPEVTSNGRWHEGLRILGPTDESLRPGRIS